MGKNDQPGFSNRIMVCPSSKMKDVKVQFDFSTFATGIYKMTTYGICGFVHFFLAKYQYLNRIYRQQCPFRGTGLSFRVRIQRQHWDLLMMFFYFTCYLQIFTVVKRI